MMNGYKFDIATETMTISASFAKKASKVGSPEYNTILKLRHDYPNVQIVTEAKKEGKSGLCYTQMEDFMKMHRNSKELLATFERVKKLSRVQSMPYKYVKEWFENRFPYYTDDPAFDRDGYVIDPKDAENPKLEESTQVSDAVPVEATVC